MREREMVGQARKPDYCRSKPLMVYKPVEFTQAKAIAIHGERAFHGAYWANDSKLNCHAQEPSMAELNLYLKSYCERAV